MGNPYPAQVADENYEVRVDGRITFTDPNNQPGATYTPPTDREDVVGNPVTIANGDDAYLTWDAKGQGSDLLDLTIPAHPKIVTAGVYAITARVLTETAMTAAGYAEVELHMDENGIDATSNQFYKPPATTARLNAAPSLVWYCPANADVSIIVTNFDGSASRDFRLDHGFVQRIS